MLNGEANMAKHIGIVACSAEGAALCYRTICGEAPELMGEHRHPEVTMHTFPLADYMVPIRKGDWRAVADLMLASCKKVVGAGAQFVICPDNTIHEAFDMVAAESPVSWLHIASAVLREADRQGYRALGILGTRYLMEGSVYSDYAARAGLGCVIPREPARQRINQIIFDELVYGVFHEESRLYFNQVMDEMKERGADAAVLGCTEIPLLVRPDDAPLPVLDSTRLLARAALRESLR